jgi:GNAT superfamily N-acetyltransferase
MDRPGPDRAHLPVRRATSGDVAQIRGLAVDNAMFAPEDLDALDETFTGYLDGSLVEHRWIVVEDPAGVIAGAAYYAPEPFADRVWNLYFLAVRPVRHRTGIGHALVSHTERSLRGAGDTVARVLIVETSSTDPYQPARRFYAREGFDQEAVIREFYGPGDNKIVFWKRLVGERRDSHPRAVREARDQSTTEGAGAGRVAGLDSCSGSPRLRRGDRPPDDHRGE